jgi:hypothetical protein
MEDRLPFRTSCFFSTIMPVATVKDCSLRFSYEDTGPLGGLYTTLVMVHGTGFHSGKLCPSGNKKAIYLTGIFRHTIV